MKIKVSEATNLQLDWLVAKCLGHNVVRDPMEFFSCPVQFWVWEDKNTGHANTCYQQIGEGFSPTANWAQGGPIIGREQIDLGWVVDHWQANKPYNYNKSFHGSDPQHPLIAAMRCFVASKLGDEAEVPEELT